MQIQILFFNFWHVYFLIIKAVLSIAIDARLLVRKLKRPWNFFWLGRNQFKTTNMKTREVKWSKWPKILKCVKKSKSCRRKKLLPVWSYKEGRVWRDEYPSTKGKRSKSIGCNASWSYSLRFNIGPSRGPTIAFVNHLANCSLRWVGRSPCWSGLVTLCANTKAEQKQVHGRQGYVQ